MGRCSTNKHEKQTRRAPTRSAQVWAREFLAALGGETVVSVEAIEQIAAKDKRLRERVPSAVLAIMRSSADSLGLSVADWLRMAERFSGLMVLKEHTVRRQVNELGRALGMGSAEVKKQAKATPMLLGYGKGVLQRRMRHMRRTIGLPAPVWRRCVRRRVALVTSKPATFVKLVRGQRRVLGLTAAAYREVIARDPQLLSRSPDAIAKVIREMMALWGFGRKEARELISKSPKLARSSVVATMDRNLEILARGLGVEKDRIVMAVRRFPPLAYQNPERIVHSLDAGSIALGVRQEALVEAVLRAPSLIARRLEGWGVRMRLVRRVSRALQVDVTAEDVLAQLPAAMTYSQSRLLQRYVVARLGLWTWNWSALLTVKDERVRELLTAYFARHPERSALQVALVRRNLL